mmetsp:Transcript_13882/g.26627  ORF Transcript_13882/g.26627 Transcript_13882/m.26627 type:complete len:597 (+) Transcript_13882:225-2015(+)
MSNSLNSNNGDEIVDIVLEMVGRGLEFPVAVRKASVGGDRVKLVVDLPTVVGAEQANLTAAMILGELDRLPPKARVAGILMASLRFTEEGADGIQAFLASHAEQVRHVALHDVLPAGVDAGSMARLVQLCQAFELSPLQVLDVSRNVIVGPTLFKVWKGAIQTLEQIILDGVIMDTAAWKGLAGAFAWEQLEDLHVVLQKGPDSPAAMEAVESILRNCTRLSSLRWIQRTSEGAPLPCQGLREMASNMLKVNTRGGSLRHLVFGGSYFPPNTHPEDVIHMREWKNLCAALQDMPRLRTLKLRSLGMTDVDRLAASLRHARPPLEVLDLSFNMISNVQALLDFCNIPKITKELRAIVLSHNLIDTKQGRDLYASFSGLPIDVTLDNNKVDFGLLIRNYQDELRSIEIERDELRAGEASIGGSASAEMSVEMNALRAENKRLRDDRDTMMRAFSLLGSLKQVEEHKKLLDRVQRLEDMVVLGAVFKSSSERGGSRGSGDKQQHHLDRRGSRRRLAADLPLDRLRSVSSRSIGSGNRSHRSQSTAVAQDDVEKSPSGRSRASSPGSRRDMARGVSREDITDDNQPVFPASPVRLRRGPT